MSHNLLTTALLFVGLINSATASKARHPFTLDKDLKAYGENGADNVDAFYNTELPKLITDVEAKIQCLHDDCPNDLAIEA